MPLSGAPAAIAAACTTERVTQPPTRASDAIRRRLEAVGAVSLKAALEARGIDYATGYNWATSNRTRSLHWPVFRTRSQAVCSARDATRSRYSDGSATTQRSRSTSTSTCRATTWASRSRRPPGRKRLTRCKPTPRYPTPLGGSRGRRFRLCRASTSPSAISDLGYGTEGQRFESSRACLGTLPNSRSKKRHSLTSEVVRPSCASSNASLGAFSAYESSTTCS
jgi:hypothetical protein